MKSLKDPIANRTRDVSACNAVPKSTSLWRLTQSLYHMYTYIHHVDEVALQGGDCKVRSTGFPQTAAQTVRDSSQRNVVQD